MTQSLRAVLLLAFAVSTACGGDDDDDSDSCVDTTGSWRINGCYSLNCSIAQNNCSITVTCTTLGQTATFTGTVDDNQLTFANDMGGSCEGVINGTQMVGSCTGDAGMCEWDADKL